MSLAQKLMPLHISLGKNLRRPPGRRPVFRAGLTRAHEGAPVQQGDLPDRRHAVGPLHLLPWPGDERKAS